MEQARKDILKELLGGPDFNADSILVIALERDPENDGVAKQVTGIQEGRMGDLLYLHGQLAQILAKEVAEAEGSDVVSALKAMHLATVKTYLNDQQDD